MAETNIVKFPGPGTTLERRLWDEYMRAVADFHRKLPETNIETMRACVVAYDAFMAEFTKDASHGT